MKWTRILFSLVAAATFVSSAGAAQQKRPPVLTSVPRGAPSPVLTPDGPVRAIHLRSGDEAPAVMVAKGRAPGANAATGAPEIEVSGADEVVDGEAISFSFAVTAGDTDLTPFTLDIEYSEGLNLGIDPQGWDCTFGAPGHASCEWPTDLLAGATTSIATLHDFAHPPYGGIAECDPGRSPCAFLRATLAGVTTAVKTTAIVVNGNHPPVAVDDTTAVPSPPAPITFEVLYNDSDVDGELLTPSIAVPPTQGTAAVDPATRQVLYTPDASFSGTDTFRYRVTDPSGASATALVTVHQLAGSISFQSSVLDFGNVEPGRVSLKFNLLENTTGLDLLGGWTLEPVDPAEFPGLLAGTGYDPAQAVSDVSVFKAGGVLVNAFPSIGGFGFPCRLNPPVGRVWLARVRVALSPVTSPTIVLAASYVVVARSADPSEVPVRVVDDVVTTPADTPLLVHPLVNDVSVAGLPMSVTGLAIAEPFHFDLPFMEGTLAFADSQGGGGVPFLGALYTPPSGFTGTTSFYYAASETPGGLINGRYDYAKVTVIVGGASNHAPILGSLSNFAVPELTRAVFTATASDPDGDVLTFSLVGAPAGASIGSGTGAFFWSPSEAQGPGTYTFNVRVTDSASPALFDEKPVTITVIEINSAPGLTLPSLPAHINAGVPFAFTATASDRDIPANSLGFSLAGAPLGAGIVATTGAFAWTPTAAQAGATYTFTVVVTDDGTPALAAQQSVTVIVDSAPPALALFVSTAADRSNPQGLAGRTLSRQAYIFVEPGAGVTRVRFWLDDPSRTGPPRQVENVMPFDFAGTAANGSAQAFDTRTVANGSHVVSAEVTLTGGTVVQLQASFMVANSAPALLVSPSPNRANPRALLGASVRNDIFVFVQADPDAIRVRFWLDALALSPPHHTETSAPWDLEGTAANGNAAPFDTRTISRGPHFIRATVDYPGGVSVSVGAVFLVTR